MHTCTHSQRRGKRKEKREVERELFGDPLSAGVATITAISSAAGTPAPVGVLLYEVNWLFLPPLSW